MGSDGAVVVSDDEVLTVAGLHAYVYCPRLFFLEELEKLRLADYAVAAGRRLHAELAKDAAEGTWERVVLTSSTFGLTGRVDVLRRVDGQLIPYEHKRGRSAPGVTAPEAWASDRAQVIAYAIMLEESRGQPVHEGRVRYHADRRLVRVPVDASARTWVDGLLRQMRALRSERIRPPVLENARRCEKCSLAPICLPEEARLARDPSFRPIRLLPEHETRQSLHVTDSKSRVGASGRELVVRGDEETRVPVNEVGQLVVYGHAQVTTQALRLCVQQGVGVHWMTYGGHHIASLSTTEGSAHRQARQFAALAKEEVRLALAKRLVLGKGQNQLRIALRLTRDARTVTMAHEISEMRLSLRRVDGVTNARALLGYEGLAARSYFAILKELSKDLPIRFSGRSRRPPRDEFNAILSFGYGMLYRLVLGAIVGVGLHPGLGIYHQLRSSAMPLALDLMELFRVPIVDVAVWAAVRRSTFDVSRDFVRGPDQVLLSEHGREVAIEVFERRLDETWKHSVVGYSLSYRRLVELEVRLLEKEWSGEPGLFARFRLR